MAPKGEARQRSLPSPKPLGLLLEPGLPRGVTIDAVGGLVGFDAIMAGLQELHAAPGDYKSLVIDTVDVVEGMILDHVCKANNWRNIEQAAYGKGYVIADNEWRRFIRAIDTVRNKHGILVMLVCHAAVERVDDPRAPTYTSYQPRLHKRARALVMDACDAVFFLAEDLRVVTEDGGFGNEHARRRLPGAFYSPRGARRLLQKTGSGCRRRSRCR